MNKRPKDTGTPVKTIVERTLDADGNTVEEKREETRIVRSGEPDYIKIYTRMWMEFNEIDPSLAPLFLQLIARMSYADAKHPDRSQIVYTCKPASTSICEALGIKERQFQRGLAALKECGAIRRIARGAYQINPEYAGRGSWHYDERLHRGGISNLIATFNFATGHNDTRFEWTEEAQNGGTTIMYTTDNLAADFGEFEEDEELNSIMNPEEGNEDRNAS